MYRDNPAKSLRPLDEVIAAAREQCNMRIKESAETYARLRDRRIDRIERNRRVIAMLDAEGFTVDLMWGTSGDDFIVRLGFFPSTKAGSHKLARELRAIRLLLECKLGQPDKSLNGEERGKNQVLFTLRPEGYEGCRIQYVRRLPRGAKCRIVATRTTSRHLVCEV